MICPPHCVQNFRALFSVLLNVPIVSAPFVTFTESGFQSEKAFIGPADQDRQSSQWQYPIPSGVPVTSISTAPQKHAPLCVSLNFVSSLWDLRIVISQNSCVHTLAAQTDRARPVFRAVQGLEHIS